MLKNKNQSGFTLWNIRRRRIIKDDSTGFIPMLILFIIVVAAIIYLVFTQVAQHQK